ncbi:MAG: hypothetical protein KAI17_16820, partial [Thiotrichaceae bacterium]|nr:hypothetical protein [Thiotrichaceae bacterium]
WIAAAFLWGGGQAGTCRGEPSGKQTNKLIHRVPIALCTHTIHTTMAFCLTDSTIKFFYLH